MYIGLYGGTFNPIHLGHLRAAVEIVERFRMKEMIFIPSFLPPHKDSPEIADPIHRLKMVNLAVTGNPQFSTSEIEIQRRGKSYSIDTVKALKEQRPDENLAFVLGLDAFLEIHTWHKYEEIFSQCDFIVFDRPGAPKKSCQQALPEKLRESFKKKAGVKEFIHPTGKKVIFTEVTRLEISGTMIRNMVHEGRSIRYLLPRRVMEYISESGLYK